MKESDNLVSLHAQIRECDTILTQMESLLGGFQVIRLCTKLMFCMSEACFFLRTFPSNVSGFQCVTLLIC